MKNKIDESIIKNELKQGSAFFSRKPTESQKRTSERSDERSNGRPNSIKPRKKIRHSFDVFEDQLFKLQTIQLKAVQAGERKSPIGRMVQEAIDDWLKKQTD